MVNTSYSEDEEKEGDIVDVSGVVLTKQDAEEALDEYDEYYEDDFEPEEGVTGGVTEQKVGDYDTDSSGDYEFGKKIVSKATESVRQIAKKKGIYIVGRKGKKFLGIRFTKKGNYSKNKKGRPNGKMYTYDGLKKMTNKRVSFKKLPELIDMMNTKAVLKKYKNFKFGFELKRDRSCGFGYTFPVGAGYGRRSALLYSKL